MNTRPGPAQGAYRPRLQRRLMLAFAGYTLLVGALMGGLAMAFVYAVEDSFFASALQDEATRQQAHRSVQGSWMTPALPFMRLYARGEGLPTDLASELVARPQRQEAAGAQGRHYHLQRLHADGSLLVAEVSGQLVVRPLRQTLLAWLSVTGASLVLLALLLGWALARRMSAPLALLAGRVAEGAPDALPQGLSRGLVRDEVGELAHHLETLHDRTRAFIDRERAFTADASHELRTPLAVLRIAVERLHADAPVLQRPLLASMQAAVWQLQQTIELLLALARETPGARGSQRSVPPIEQPLLPVLERMLLANAPLLDQLDVQVGLQVPAGLTRPWPPALTQVLVSNLLANAITHAQRAPADRSDAPGCALRVEIEADAASLRVWNPSVGPLVVLQNDDASSSRGNAHPGSSGLGLGLSIVRRLAEQHRLSLNLHHADGHTCVTLR